ncbi:glycosyltransferase family 2 protein [Terribacillus sp. DMT04]|uniref:glycosyltransferase family 2 protein n=1 Tax=Terribacillus sp. DMT04 TaxID=2850441 RepID=UPI001C2C6FF1|nr:glycosyltransferase family 2 protein [Terribacillus sp. DMT04]QXE01064.1 glycosyltransferase [Terribacillus sp. DMT04]
MATVGVVIPTKNRAETIGRALESVFAQVTRSEVSQIVIVDDGSEDNTSSVVEGFIRNDQRVKYVKNSKSVGGAKARNQGAELLTSDYVAFLDSDDEWKLNHLQNAIEVIEYEESGGVFGSYTISDGISYKDRIIPLLQPNMNVAEYIFSDTGDIRTSTIVMRLDSFKEVMFDSDQHKHQDWDLAIRFSKKYKLSIDQHPSVILHEDLDNRMSKSMKHQATQYFIRKHRDIVSDIHLSKFYYSMCRDTLKLEGKNKFFYEYRHLFITYFNKVKTKNKSMLVRRISLYLPRRTFVYLSSKRSKA